ncbi:MAG TPA: radical SAM protein [Deltaproteobacteria bacterium]|nr:radical SAM protein [Deltaproteobacteria bacterium]
MKNARVLLLYVDRYYLIKQVYPFGLDLIASYLREHGHQVTLEYPFLPGPDLKSNLSEILERTRPQVVGLGIRNIDTCMSCEAYGDYGDGEYRTFYFLPDVREIAGLIKKHAPGMPVVAGGGGFTISPEAILKYLGLEYGIVGQGEESLLRFIEAWPDREKLGRIPGLARLNGGFRVNPGKAYGFSGAALLSGRDRKFQYALERMGLPVQVKRGCNQGCSYCVEPIIEGREFTFREIGEVMEELGRASLENEGVRNIFFVDTEFNLPNLSYCSQLVERIVEQGLSERFSFSSQFLPRPFDRGFARLLTRAGFSVILTCDSFSDHVLERNHASYREEDTIRALNTCEEFGLDCAVSMVFGLPGETHDTLNHSIERMKQYPPGFFRRYEYTIGARIYRGTRLCRTVERGGEEAHLYGIRSKGLIEPFYFCAPVSPRRIKLYVEESLGYTISYENRYDETAFQSLAIAYGADQGRWEEAMAQFRESNLPARSAIYDYLFRKLTGSGRIHEARLISQELLSSMEQYGGSGCRDQMELIRFYMSMTGTQKDPST